MLAEGQVADAERLLSKLAGSAEGEPRVNLPTRSAPAG